MDEPGTPRAEHGTPPDDARPHAGASPPRPPDGPEAAGTGRQSFWRRPAGKITVAVVVVLVVLIGASFTAARMTESNRFCGTDCHEMWPYRDTWAASTHKNVNCVRCHIPPGPINFLETKFFALREVFVHFTGQVKAPIKVTRHIPNSVCQGCHAASQIGAPVTLGSPAPVTFHHDSAGHSKQLCIACHSQVVHQGLPGTALLPPQSMGACFKCHTNGPTNCSYCHQAPHQNRGPCQNCHNLGAWFGGKNFVHPQPLVGTHAQIACEQCHTKGVSVPPAGCINCHGDQHNGLVNCIQCHVLAHWIPSTFSHPQEGPHVPRGDEPLNCNACHLKGFGQPASCPCHGNNPPTGGG
jgi:nitrate/TMAO reductase-like tetraheme cytochrome c subunit